MEISSDQWYEHDDEGRKRIFSKYSIEDFWNWWSDGDDVVMEIRIVKKRNDDDLFRDINGRFGIPWVMTSLFAESATDLKNILYNIHGRYKHVWYGANPRIKTKRVKTGKVWYGITDEHINTIRFLVFDIDRRDKSKATDSRVLADAHEVAQLMIKFMQEIIEVNDYMLVFSGNGVQLLFRLDEPLELTPYKLTENPNPEAANKFIKEITIKHRRDLEFMSAYVKERIFKHFRGIKQYKESSVELDPSVYTVNRVAALPYTMNMKSGDGVWRGIIDMVKDGENTGLNAELWDFRRNFKPRRATVKRRGVRKKTKSQYLVDKSDLMTHPLAQLMLSEHCPEGDINNTIWYWFKIVLEDSGYKFVEDDYIRLRSELQQRLGRTLPDNPPSGYENTTEFTEAQLRTYCLWKQIPLFMPVEIKRTDMYNKKFYISIKPFDIDHIYANAGNYSSKIRDYRFSLRHEDKDIWNERNRLSKDIYRSYKFFLDKKGTLAALKEVISAIKRKYGVDTARYFIEEIMRHYFFGVPLEARYEEKPAYPDIFYRLKK